MVFTSFQICFSQTLSGFAFVFSSCQVNRQHMIRNQKLSILFCLMFFIGSFLTQTGQSFWCFGYVMTERFFEHVGASPNNKPYFPHIKINGFSFMTSALQHLHIYKTFLYIARQKILEHEMLQGQWSYYSWSYRLIHRMGFCLMFLFKTSLIEKEHRIFVFVIIGSFL